ncbi:MAG: VWA domain-containing protein [Planctomycetes bacterium]|nr:VWA domain-containing protein [Planctomycetota bacterium]
MPIPAVLCLFACCAPLAAQQGQAEFRPDPAKVAAAIRAWIEAFENGRLGAKGTLRSGAELQPKYASLARQCGLLGDDDIGRLTHLDVLQKLMLFAEREPGADAADALLGVAAAGLDGAFLDGQALELRELGHWALMRMEDQDAWFCVLRAAAGERVPLLDDLRGVARADADREVVVGPARRVAALRLIGRRNLPVFRATLEQALVDADPRVRLAAAEAITPPWRVETMRRVRTALLREQHPVVSQALVRLLLLMLKAMPAGLDAEDVDDFVTSALRQFGRCGWRTDMDLLDLVAAFPRKNAIPLLIQALDLEVRSPDALVAAINKRASPRLRERAGGLLRAMTGALLPADDPEAWRRFWQQERERIVVPAKLPGSDPQGTRATFFGVPVTGGAIAFLIDTRGSMDRPSNGPTTGARGRDAETRLEAAKAQLVLAAQAMPDESTYVLMTFAERARTWTPTPIRPGSSSARSLTELLSRLRPHGGTNLHDGLVTALASREQTYGANTAVTIDELFVLSDGEPTSGEVRDEDGLLAIVREANRYAKVRIHTVFTGTGAMPALLRRLAEENGGVAVQR